VNQTECPPSGWQVQKRALGSAALAILPASPATVWHARPHRAPVLPPPAKRIRPTRARCRGCSLIAANRNRLADVFQNRRSGKATGAAVNANGPKAG